jgi:DNA-binding response OmpR family regulator
MNLRSLDAEVSTMSGKQTPKLTDPTGRAHDLTGDMIKIGRAVENEIVVSSKRISREHACVRREGWRVILEDLGSTNGTFLNEQRIHAPMQLRDGDHIKVGDVEFVFHDPDVTYQDTVLPELEMDIPAGMVRVNRQLVELAPKEFELLAYMFSRSGLVCSKDEIGTAVWPEYRDGVYDYQIENLVSRLRTKLEPDSANPQLLITVRGRGYKLVVNG